MGAAGRWLLFLVVYELSRQRRNLRALDNESDRRGVPGLLREQRMRASERRDPLTQGNLCIVD